MLGKKDRNETELAGIFEKYVPKEVLDSINKTYLIKNDFTERNIEYIIILFNENEFLFENIKKSIEFFIQYDCIIDTMDSIYLKIIVNYLKADGLNSNVKVNTIGIDQIVNLFAESKISFESCIFGEEKCKIGNIGSEKKMHHTVIIPDYKSKLVKLITMKNGEIKRLTTAST